MKKSSLWVAIALMMAMTTAGCSKDDDTITNVSQPDVVTPADPEKPAESEEPQVPNPEDLLLTRSELDMVQQSNDFAFVQLDGDIVVGQHLREPFADAVDLYHRRLCFLFLFHKGPP